MKCNFCLTGKYHFCRGNIPIGVKRDGGFARFCIVPMAQVYELPKSVNLKQGRILEACPSCLNFVFGHENWSDSNFKIFSKFCFADFNTQI